MIWRDNFSESDIPRIFCHGLYGANIFETVYNYLKEEIFLYFSFERNHSVDWREVASFVHGISPDTDLIFRPGAKLDPMVEDWDKCSCNTGYSPYVEML